MAESMMKTKIVLRHDNTDNWIQYNPILNKAEAGVEFTKDGKIKIKFGNGVNAWVDLPYFGGECESLDDLRAIIDKIENTYETKKYEITNVPKGTLINYKDSEIRVMCPVDAEFTLQNVGPTGNPNAYYMAFKVYAPDNAVSFKEGDRGVIIDSMFTFEDDFAGIDEYGRKYSICWLALASYDPNTKEWTYYGKNSSTKKYIGWDYVVEWYDAEGIKIGFDGIRINLSNESCHYNNEPYFMGAINIDKLVQNEGQYLELYGGSASDNI